MRTETTRRDTIKYGSAVLAGHPVRSKVTAVQNDDRYLGGTPYQGPIINLLQTEMAAKQLYPEESARIRSPLWR
jgi:hypothetical protein